MSGAQVGDKTMMDALIPASRAIAAYAGSDEDGLFAAAAKAAAEGAENSKNFVSKFGRAQELRHPDHRHAGRRRHVHVLFLPGPGPGVIPLCIQTGGFAMKMKKFINAPETITDEELVGLGLAYSDILTVDGHLVISKDLEKADRVTIVTYGGSGHEPAQAGFVGRGMLDIQAVGDIFAAPNGQLVFDAMKLADKGHGVLLLTLNYAGDQLAGKQAMKLAKKAGLNVRQVITGEEIQYDPNGEDNKRGLAGAVALYHIAAAAAREGKSLDEVAEIAQRYADNMASLTVKSTDATHPQNGMSFGDLGETDLMEIGAGQHGEGGGVRVPMMSSKDTVATVAEALCKALDLKPGDKTFVMINGCGATTMMEMLVLFKDTVEFLKAKGIEVVASMVGEILTVQEAAGFQMNIAKWDEEMLRLWNTPCRTPAFSKE